MNREVESSGMGVKVAPPPFELKASGTDIIYTERLGEVATEYVDGETVTGGKMTSRGRAAIKWVMTSSNDMNNVREAEDETELKDITRLESDKYTLKKEINTFIENVDNDLYIIPNRIVSKDKRSKWRFEVKNYIKQLNAVPVDGENGKESAKLLRELYKRLAHGCGYHIFSTDDPFRSVGIRQPDFYEMLIKRTFATGFTDENIKNMLEDAAFVFIDRESLHSELEMIFAKSLKTSDLKYKAVDFIKEYMEQREDEFRKTNKYSNNIYRLQCDIEELCETMLVISIMLYEPEEAVEFYWKHDKSRDSEITLYKILDTIQAFGDEKLWISVYEDGIKRGIHPRDYLEKMYDKIKV